MQPPSQPLKRHLAPGQLQQASCSCSSTSVPPALSRQQSRDAPPAPRANCWPKPTPPPPAAVGPPPARNQECAGAPPPTTTRPARGALYQPLQQEKCRIKP
ncbi:hypothetical protein NDU88_004177 [Pleurodeles waltl]|uniref:Uncharacterized protein n=1 Tax=Pleurodeles waltl TaxID=8319 RepID=A0AAV7SI24_PLEWA|nr:hypothetical protein NDU88_004177 [Pleurodeles waltl]